jgi:hypothetical protein
MYSFSRTKSFRILFESKDHSGKIGWTTIEDCKDMDDAISYFMSKFTEHEIIQIREIVD